jgi:hypothetical protein
MNFETVVDQTDNGTTAEVVTLHHEGHEFTAHGAILDLSGGYVGCYVREREQVGPHPDSHYTRMGIKHGPSRKLRGDLIDFQGNVIGSYTVSGEWHRWGNYERYTMRSVRARINGDDREWIGRYECEWNQFINLRPRKVKHVA